MKNIPRCCITETSDSLIKFEERGSVIYFNNPKKQLYKKIDVDGCAITDTKELKCDKALCSADEKEEHYVELKGSDISHAIKQLYNTILKLGQYDNNRHSYIVCSQVAPAFTSYIQVAKKKFKQKLKATLLVKNKKIEADLPAKPIDR